MDKVEQAVDRAIDAGLKGADLVAIASTRPLTREDLHKFVAMALIQHEKDQGRS